MRKGKKICPKCRKEMTEVYTAIGGFPGHPHIHPGPLWGYQCKHCGHEENVKDGDPRRRMTTRKPATPSQ